MKLKDLIVEKRLDVPTKTPEQLAKKHGVSVATIEAALKQGVKIEHEHTSDDATAREIALDHLGEDPKYYTKLKAVEEGKTIKALPKIRNKDLNDVLKAKRGGGHFSKKSDFKRAKEKEKFHKEMFSRWDGQ